MRAIIQRVKRASVTVDGEVVGSIGPGIMLLLGVSKTDTQTEATAMVEKVMNLRIFDDAEGKMNLSLSDTS
ncbi:MAG: D-aminoacyl-tRNA deacylase, partial [Acidobacteriota bacterium]